MTVTNSTAWLENPWLQTTWLGADIEDSTAQQVELRIDVQTAQNQQTERRIDVQTPVAQQFEGLIEAQAAQNQQAEQRIDVLSAVGSQSEQRIDIQEPVGAQSEMRIDVLDPIGMQAEQGLNVEEPVGTQAELQIVDAVSSVNQQSRPFVEVLEDMRQQAELAISDVLSQQGAQVELKIEEIGIRNAQVYSSNLYWVRCEGWLESAWLTKAWLARNICASSRQQAELRIDSSLSVGAQAELVINAETGIRQQAELRIDTTADIGAQADLQFISRIPAQVIITLYNITRPRIMCEFPSRGVTGLNWTYYRSASGITTVNLDCDTEVAQGIFMDTFYMEGHNLTSSAVVVFEGTNDPTYTTISWSENLTVQDDKIFYVEPTLPLTSYRYWRLRIQDPTNTDGYIKIGLIVFGASNILNSECATQDIIITPREFKNALRTEGFTSVGNSRSLKRSVKLEFRSVSYDSGDYDTLNDVMNFSRTTLKCLWLPDARSQSLMSRFGVFGKIRQMPSQRHNVKGINENMDFIDFTIEIDEAE
jgi:hypothetical protein